MKKQNKRKKEGNKMRLDEKKIDLTTVLNIGSGNGGQDPLERRMTELTQKDEGKEKGERGKKRGSSEPRGEPGKLRKVRREQDGLRMMRQKKGRV